MNIIKEDHKIILELNDEEEETILYFIHNRKIGTAVLNEYLDHWMKGRIETKRTEENQLMLDRFNNLSKEEQVRLFGGIIKDG